MPTQPPPIASAEPESEVESLRRQLSAAEERFRAAAGGMLDAFYLLEAERGEDGVIFDFRFQEINGMGETIIGRSREEVLGLRLCELLPINRERGYFAKYAHVVETGEPMLEEASFGEVDGIHAAWLQFQAVKVGDGVAIHTKDITQRKRQEQETQRLYGELQMIFNAVPAMIFYKDCHNNVVRVNQAVASALDLPTEQIEGRSCEELFPEEAAAYYRDDFAVLQSRQPKLGYVEPQTLPDGRRTWIRTDKTPLYDEEGEPLGLLAVVTDITAQRNSALQAAVLEKAVEERQAMGRNLHDGIGQEMTGVRMLIEKVRRQARRGEVPSEDALNEIAAVIASASKEIRRMIAGLTPERITPDELPVALGQVASNVQSFYGIQTSSDCDGGVEGLDVEAANHFLAIAQESAINAAKHAGASRIRISLEVDSAGYVLSVSDNGRGLPEGVLETDGTESTGRGLQILNYRAAALGATLQLGHASEPCGEAEESGQRSAPGGPGTRVCCTLPR